MSRSLGCHGKLLTNAVTSCGKLTTCSLYPNCPCGRRYINIIGIIGDTSSLQQLKKQAIFIMDTHEVHNFHAKLTMSSVGTGPESMLLPAEYSLVDFHLSPNFSASL